MKTFIGILVFAGATHGFGAIGPNCEDFFRYLDSAHQHKDGAAIVRLAAETVGKDCWSMGGGQGPTDATSFRMRAFWIGSDVLFDQNGLLREDVKAALSGTSSNSEKLVLGWLSISPTDTAQMLSLLNNTTDASARWIGIYKTRALPTPPPPIVQALRNIALTDNNIMLADNQISCVGPTPEANLTREFKAVLRSFANEQLAKWNAQLVINETDVAQAGYKNLLDDFSSHPEHRRDILWAVSRLNLGHSSVAEQALRNLSAPRPDLQDSLNEFRKAAKLY